jgi:hypothetical protein
LVKDLVECRGKICVLLRAFLPAYIMAATAVPDDQGQRELRSASDGRRQSCSHFLLYLGDWRGCYDHGANLRAPVHREFLLLPGLQLLNVDDRLSNFGGEYLQHKQVIEARTAVDYPVTHDCDLRVMSEPFGFALGIL